MNYLREYWVLALVLAVCLVVILFLLTLRQTAHNESEGIHPLTGIAGWGYIIAASAVIEPFRHLYLPIVYWYNLYELGALTTLPIWYEQSTSVFAYAIIFNGIGALALIGAFSYIAYLFFKKKKLFIGFSILWTWSYLAFWSLQMMSRSSIFSQFNIFDSNHVSGFIGGLIWILGWVMYLKKSERMKINFVN